MAFTFSVSDLKKGAETIKKQGERGGKYNNFSFDKPENYLLILQKDSQFMEEIVTHDLWKAKKLVHKVGSPQSAQEEDPIVARGWEIFEKFKESENKKLKDLFKKYMPRNQTLVRVIDLKDIEKGVQIASIPKMMKDAIIDQVSEIETEEDAKKIFDLNMGRVFKIVHNGEKGFDRKYTVAKFLDKTAGLVKSGKVDADEIEKQLFDLKKLQPAWDDAKLKKHLALIEEEVKFIIDEEGGEEAGFDDIGSGDSGDDFEFSSNSSDDEDFDLD